MRWCEREREIHILLLVLVCVPRVGLSRIIYPLVRLDENDAAASYTIWPRAEISRFVFYTRIVQPLYGCTYVVLVWCLRVSLTASDDVQRSLAVSPSPLGSHLCIQAGARSACPRSRPSPRRRLLNV